jgi:hypothetical protein
LALIDKTTPIATLGSCFALELVRGFHKRGYMMTLSRSIMEKVQGKREQLALVRKNRELREMIWYNSYSILYEFERAFLGKQRRDWSDVWVLKSPVEGGTVFYQDPMRRLTHAPTMEKLRERCAVADKHLSHTLRTAEVFVLTLGMSEMWKSKKNGLVACHHPLYGLKTTGRKINMRHSTGVAATEFYNASMEENEKNLRRIAGMVHDNIPNASIIYTVSPVPFERTFTNLSLEEGNRESKEKLMTAARRVASNHSNVHYFDSYEYCMGLGPEECFMSDRRHVRRGVVAKNIERFEERFCTGESK